MVGVGRTCVMHDYYIVDSKECIQRDDIFQYGLRMSGYVSHDECFCCGI